MKLTDYASPSTIRVPLVATDKTQAIAKMVDVVVEQGMARSRDELLAAVMEREGQRTTGIGRGFAIPHAKSDTVNKLVLAFGRLAEPIDFASIDGQPVSLLAMLISPTSATTLHIQALARLSRMVTNEAILDALLSAQSSDAFFKVIADHDGP